MRKALKFNEATVKKIVCGVMIIVGIVIIVFTVQGQGSHEQKCKDNEATIVKLETSIAELEKHKTESAEDINKGMYSAANAGDEVAKYQSAYQAIDAIANPDGVKANAEKLSALFADDAQDGRAPWFTITKGDGKAVWEFKSTYSTSSEKIPVIWTCRVNGNTDLVAYATATYDAKTNKFTNVSYELTQTANKYVDATVESDSKSRINSVISDLQKQSGGDSGMNEKDAQNQSDARQWLNEQYEKESGE